jgi:HEAT repeat protein
LGSPAAVEVLLGFLDSTERANFAPHRRDIAWEGLELVSDAYGQGRVAEELRKNRGNAWMREWCAEALGHYGDPAHGPVLVKALTDPELEVQRAAARALGRMGFAGGESALETHVRSKDALLRALAMETLARADAPRRKAEFLQWMTDEDGGVRCLLLGAAPAIYPELAGGASAAALADPDWRVRVQALENLESVREKPSVVALVDALDDLRPAVVSRAMRALETLTLREFREPAHWRTWWRDRGADFEVPPPPAESPAGKPEPGDLGDPAGGAGDPPPRPPPSEPQQPEGGHGADSTWVAVYNEIRVESDHVAFLVDRSGSMSEQLESRGTTKSAAAETELAQVLDALPDGTLVDFHCYADEVESLAKEPAALTPKLRAKALKFVESQPLRGSKDIWAVLQTVLADPEIDTAFLLSSGEPEVGEYVHWNRVTMHLRELNRARKLTVHTIAYSDSKWYRDQLEEIAKVTGGEFRAFE